MSSPLRLLILEDNPADAELLVHELRRAGFAVDWQRVETQEDYLARLDPALDLILGDYSLPQFDGFRALQLLQARGLDIPFILISGTIGEELAVTAIKLGAADYIMKDRLKRLGPAVLRALDEKRLRREQQHTAEALRESEERYRAVADSAYDAIISTDSDGAIVGWNRGAQQIFGYAAAEVMGKSIEGIMAPPFRESHQRRMLGIGAGGNPHVAGRTVELSGLRKDGTEFPAELSYSEWETAQGKFYTAIIRDITERKQAEQELILFRTLIDRSNDAIEVLDPETLRFLDMNEKCCLDLGYSRNELLSLTILDIDPSMDQGAAARINSELEKSGTITIEGWHKRKDGSKFPVEANIRQVQLDRGYFVAVVRDITERKRAEAALLESNAQFRTLFEASPDAIMLIDPHDNWPILDCNTASCHMNGYARDELVGQSIDVLNISPGIPTERAAYLEQIRKSGVLRLEATHCRKDGTVFPIEVSTSLIMLGHREVVLGIDRDITERKRAEEDTRRRANEFGALYETARDLATAQELAALLQTIVDRAAGLLHVATAAMHLYDASQDELELVVAHGLPSVLGTRAKLGEGMAGRAAQNREAIIVDNYQTWEYRSPKYRKYSFPRHARTPDVAQRRTDWCPCRPRGWQGHTQVHRRGRAPPFALCRASRRRR